MNTMLATCQAWIAERLKDPDVTAACIAVNRLAREQRETLDACSARGNWPKGTDPDDYRACVEALEAAGVRLAFAMRSLSESTREEATTPDPSIVISKLRDAISLAAERAEPAIEAVPAEPAIEAAAVPAEPAVEAVPAAPSKTPARAQQKQQK